MTILIATRPRLRLVPLHAADGLRADVVGEKAAALATADRRGLPTIDGFVIPVASSEQIAAGLDEAMQDVLFAAWAEASEDGARTLLVRTSPIESGACPATTRRHLSVPDVATFPGFVLAVQQVVESVPWGTPVAVLVQRQLPLIVGGLCFGAELVVTGAVDGACLTTRQRRAVLRLSRRAADAFGQHQEIEWAFDADGVLHLLRTRRIGA